MKKLLLIGITVTSFFATQPALAIGANSDNNLKRAVAQQVMQDTHKDTPIESITLHDVHRGLFSVTWKATTPNGEYACNADDMLRRVQCAHITA